MTHPERHDREVFTHNQKEDRQFMDYEKAKMQAIKNVKDRFDNDEGYFHKQMREYGPDALLEILEQPGFFIEMEHAIGYILVDRVYRNHFERAVEDEVKRILEESR